MSDPRKQILDWIEADREKLEQALSSFVQAKSPNPPGDTRDAVDVLGRILTEEDLPFELISPQEGKPNLVSEVSSPKSGRHLVMNGHVDVFPVNNLDAWDEDPWSGRIADGRLYGRGASDMKAGTMALLFAYIYLTRLTDSYAGRLTYTAVSDEETGGTWGSKYLLEELGDRFRCDGVLNAEPGGVGTVRFGEKGILQFKIKVRTRGAHGPYPNLSKSAVRIACQIVERLDSLTKLECRLPDKVTDRLESEEVRALIEQIMGEGTADLMSQLTVNIGVFNGGTKVNMIASECDLEVDVRMPIGITSDRVLARIDEILADFPEATAYGHMITDPSYCDPDHELAQLLGKNVTSIGLPEPMPIVSIGGSDCRFWRHAGIPAYIYGPNSKNISAPNESVGLEDFLNVVRVHALTALDYLSA
ncbi:MAG: ArgE/DapE family deacylase [Rhodovibrionaceae bacterium]